MRHCGIVFAGLSALLQILFLVLFITLVKYDYFLSLDSWLLKDNSSYKIDQYNISSILSLTQNLTDFYQNGYTNDSYGPYLQILDGLYADQPINVNGSSVTPFHTTGLGLQAFIIFAGLGLFFSSYKCLSYSGIGLMLFYGCFVAQWAALIIPWLYNAAADVPQPAKIDFNGYWAKEMFYCVFSILIAIAALIGRGSRTQMLLASLVGVVLYATNRMILLFYLGVQDLGGVMSVYSFGAFYGVFLAIPMFIHRNICKKKCCDTYTGTYVSNLLGYIGIVILVSIFPTHNAILFATNTAMHHRAILSTIFALLGSVVTAYIIASLVKCPWKLSVPFIKNAVFVGGVAVSSVAALGMQPWGGLLIGIAAAFFATLMHRIFITCRTECTVIDICVLNVFGIPGLIGACASAVCAALAFEPYTYAYKEAIYLYPAMTLNNSFVNAIRTKGEQGAYQFAGFLVSIAIGMLGGIITGIILRWICPLCKCEASMCRDEAIWFVTCDEGACCHAETCESCHDSDNCNYCNRECPAHYVPSSSPASHPFHVPLCRVESVRGGVSSFAGSSQQTQQFSSQQTQQQRSVPSTMGYTSVSL